jgi:hypothetical protein
VNVLNNKVSKRRSINFDSERDTLGSQNRRSLRCLTTSDIHMGSYAVSNPSLEIQIFEAWKGFSEELSPSDLY